MHTIAMNTLTGAVTEYDGFAFQSITPTHAGSALGLWALGGDTDNGQPIVGRVNTGLRAWDATLKKGIACAYFALRGAVGLGAFTVGLKSAAYSYPFQMADGGVSRAPAGKGIRENYLAFGFETPGGQPFVLDSIEVLVNASKTRRV